MILNNAYLATYTSQWLLRVFDVVCICLRFIILVTVPSFGNVITFRYVHKYVQLLMFGYVSEAVILHQSGEHSQVIYMQLCSWGQDSCIQNIHSISISTINVINRLVQTDKDIAQDFHHLYIVYHYNQTKSQYIWCCLRFHTVPTSPGFKTCFSATVYSLLRPQSYGCKQNHVTTI